MDTPAPAPAPTAAEPITPVAEPISAVDTAVANKDQAAYREARLAERSGKPLAPVEPPAEGDEGEPAVKATGEPAPERTLSKRQQDANENIRKAVERATADLIAENTRLKASLPQPKAEPAPVSTAAVDAKPDVADVATYPDGAYDPKFIEDLGAWSARQAIRAHDTETETRARVQAHTTSLQTRDAQFNTRIAAAKQADPDFITKLSPDVRALRPRDDLKEGEPLSPLNDVAEFILRSDIPDRLMQHFTDHPEDLKRFETLPTPTAVSFEMGQLHAQLRQPAAASLPTKTVSSAPAPTTTLGRRTTEPVDEVDAAVASGDVSAFRAARLRERSATLR